MSPKFPELSLQFANLDNPTTSKNTSVPQGTVIEPVSPLGPVIVLVINGTGPTGNSAV